MKALILGTNAGQADIISYLKQKGWEVHACGYRQEGPGCDLADEFHLADTLDVGAVKELTKDIKPDIIYASIYFNVPNRIASSISNYIHEI